MKEKKTVVFVLVMVLLAVVTTTPYLLQKLSQKQLLQQTQHQQRVAHLNVYGTNGRDLRRSGTLADLMFDVDKHRMEEVAQRVWATKLPEIQRHQLLQKYVHTTANVGKYARDTAAKSDYTIPFDVTYPAVPEANISSVHYHLEFNDLTAEGKPANARAREIFAAAHRK